VGARDPRRRRVGSERERSLGSFASGTRVRVIAVVLATPPAQRHRIAREDHRIVGSALERLLEEAEGEDDVLAPPFEVLVPLAFNTLASLAMAAELTATLKLLASDRRLVFAAPRAVDATDCKLEMPIDASDRAVLMAPDAVEMAPPAYNKPVEAPPAASDVSVEYAPPIADFAFVNTPIHCVSIWFR